MKRSRIIVIIALVVSSFCLAQKKVKTHEGVRIGGIKQWIGANSKNDQLPLLLFIHGGPGFSSRSYSKSFVKELRRHYIVAQWDQRGAGITEAWSPDAEISLDILMKDTEEVVTYLLKKFKKDKLLLVGFSWGNILGLNYATKHPENLHAYISVSGLTNGAVSEEGNLLWLKEQIAKNPNGMANQEVDKIQLPFNSWTDLYYMRKWSAYYSGVKNTERTFPKELFQDWADQWMPIFLKAEEINHSSTITELKCPYFSFLSRLDHVANYEVGESFFNGLKTPDKQLIWFDKSTHEIPTDEPKKFSSELIKIKDFLFN